MRSRHAPAAVLLSVILLLALGSCGPRMVPLDDSVSSGTLPCGMRWVFKSHPSPTDRLYFRLVLKGGASAESEGEEGYAHLVEHLAWRGTERFPGNAIDDWLDSLGMNRGPESTAFTSMDNVSYRLMVPASDVEAVKTALTVMRDWLDGMTFDPQAVEREKLVVLEELRTTYGMEKRLDDAHASSGEAESCVDGIIGSESSILEATPERLKSFWKRAYAPANAAVIVSGDAAKADILPLLEAEFKGLRRGTREMPLPPMPAFHPAEPLVTVEVDPGMTDPEGLIRWFFDSGDLSSVDGYLENRKMAVFARMLDTRLARMARDRASGIADVSADFTRFSGSVFSLDVSFALGHDAWKTGFYALLREIGSVSGFGFTEEELSFRKDADVSSHAWKSDDFRSLDSSRVAELMESFVTWGEPPVDDRFEREQFLRLKDSLSLAGLKDRARKTIGRYPDVIRLDCPPGSGDADRVWVWSVYQSAQTLIVSPPDVAPFPGYPRIDPVSSRQKNAVARRTDHDGWVDAELQNGIRVVLAPRDEGSRKICMVAVSPGGSATYPRPDSACFENVPDALLWIASDATAMGQADDLLERLAIDLQPWVSWTEEGIDASFCPSALDPFLVLLSRCFSFDSGDNVVRSFVSGFTPRENIAFGGDPETEFFSMIDTYAWEGSSYAQGSREFSLPGSDRIARIASERFSRASDFLFVFSGDFEPDAFLESFSRVMSGLPGSPVRETVPLGSPGARSGTRSYRMKNALDDKATVSLCWNADSRAEWKEMDTRSIVAEMLERALTECLRDDESGVYGVRVTESTVDGDPNESRLFVDFNCAPQRARELETKTLERVLVIAREGFGSKAYVEAKASRMASGLERDSDSYGTAGWFSNLRYSGFDPDSYEFPSPDEIDSAAASVLGNPPILRASQLPVNQVP